MKKWIVSIALGILATLANAQGSVIVGNYGVAHSNFAPSGACAFNSPLVVVDGPGTVYTCQNGIWAQVTGGGGGSGFPFTLGATSIAASSTNIAVTGLTIDGVTPTTMAFVDPTSSVQTQLNGKAASNASTTVNGQTCTLGSTCTISGGLPTPETHTVSGASEMDFTTCITSSNPNYVFNFDITVGGSTGTLGIQFSTNGGTSYDAVSGHYTFGRVFLIPGTSTSGLAPNGTSTQIGLDWIAGSTFTAGYQFVESLNLYKPADATVKFGSGFASYGAGGVLGVTMTSQFLYTNTTPYNAFRIIAQAGTTISGTGICQPSPY